jgi:hypothetical protein
MIDRRQVLTMGGLLGALVPGDGAADEGVGLAVGQMSDRAAQDVVNALKAVGTAISADRSFLEIAPVRKSQTDFLRANGHFPDFIDIAPDVWFTVYDWHIRLQQPLVLGRDVNGRYTMALGFTTLVLRHDAAQGFISTPYDSR